MERDRIGRERRSGEGVTQSRGGEEFERLHALTLPPPVMSCAASGSAGFRLQPVSTRWLSFSEKPPVLNIITPQHLLAFPKDARLPSFS